MVTYLKIIRIPNLIIVALLQAILYYKLLLPIFALYKIDSVFGDKMFIFSILITIIVVASGNVINDIFDIEIDKMNKPNKWYVGNEIGVSDAYKFYFALLIIGLFLTVWVAFYIKMTSYFLLYVFAVSMLYLYSKHLKRSFILGNVFVSIFSAGVIGIVWGFEYSGLHALSIANPSFHIFIITIFFGFMVFSFLTSMYRELIKDIEDVDGDKLVKAKTIPLIIGVDKTKFIAGLFSIVILIFLFYWLKAGINESRILMKLYSIMFVMLPLLYSVYLLKKAKIKQDFYRISIVIKIVMLTGTSLLLFYI